MKLYYALAKPGLWTQFFLTATCICCFMLYGFEQGALANIQGHEAFQSQFGYPSGSYLGIIVSIYNLGSFFGCLGNIAIGDILGRKRAIWLGLTLVIIGVILQTSSYGVVQFFIGRFISGLGTGIETSTAPMYQSEVCTAKYRGRLVAAEPMFVSVGIVMVYWVGYGLSFAEGGVVWRVPVGIQLIFAILGWLMLFLCPESPRWLVKVGKIEDAKYALSKIRNLDVNDYKITCTVNEIVHIQEVEAHGKNINWMSILKGKDAMAGRYRLALAWGIQFFNQMGGCNLVIYYMPLVLVTNVGIDTELATILSGCIMICMFVSSLVPTFFLDRMGRRPTMFVGSIALAVCMLIITVLLKQDQKNCSSAAVAFFFVYMCFFGSTMNSTPWVYGPEVLPLQLRAKGVAISTSSNWMWNFVIAMITPVMTDNLGWKTYIVFTVINAFGALCVYMFYPETGRKTLEEIEEIFLGSGKTFYGGLWDRNQKNGTEVEFVEYSEKNQLNKEVSCSSEVSRQVADEV
ncbi:unnamed protein product [Penicillium nalgiovense]|nr:unnamed protein product [Penicillium nalgiovense]CUM51889.1 unnamed protein product [Debaryomyces tyrocola]